MHLYHGNCLESLDDYFRCGADFLRLPMTALVRPFIGCFHSPGIAGTTSNTTKMSVSAWERAGRIRLSLLTAGLGLL